MLPTRGVPIPTPIYRIFDARNLRSVLQEGCFHSPRILRDSGKEVLRISHPGIMDRRETTLVPCGPGGCLTDYVAFYFAPRSPMLYAIAMNHVEGHDGNQEQIIYTVSTAQAVQRRGLPFVFTDGHGIVALTDFFDNLSRLTEVDWSIMNSQWWNDTNEYPDRKRRRQAEFLVHKVFPWDLAHEVGVKTQRMRKAVQKVISEHGKDTMVTVHPEWYY